ncbi:hypothetical protein BDD12DRAFT_802693 [Trichophaea hybrida]|nr:hypothetical protein BDD12DRAFT_802693 [Trichophaea hybrida]
MATSDVGATTSSRAPDDFNYVNIPGGTCPLATDSHFDDLTPLNTPDDNIVAVTGLAGHAYGSWRNRKTHQMWLKDFLPHDIKNVRIMSYGYNSNLVGDTVGNRFFRL